MDKLYFDKLGQPLVDLYTQMEQDILINIAKRLTAKGPINNKDDAEAWQLQQLQNLGMLDKENLKIIKQNIGIASYQINQIMYDAGIQGLDETDAGIKKATQNTKAHLKVPKPLTESPVILNILRAYQKQAADILNLTNQTLLKQSHKIYTDIINRTTADVLSGFTTHEQAMRKTIAQWAEYGIPALIDKGGKKWGTEGYVRMVVNTTAHNTTHAVQDQRIQDWGLELVEVSSHSGARPLCAPYQGRIFSLKPGHPDYKCLYTDTSYGKPAGLFGINCHHTKYPFIDGLSTQTYFPEPKKENEQAYLESQQQRAIERSIRNAKTRYEMYKAIGDDKGMEEATALVKSRQGNMRDFIDATGRTRRRDREQIVNVNDIPKKPLPKEVKQVAIPVNIPQTAAAPFKPVNFADINIGDKIEYKDKFGNIFGGTVNSKLSEEVQIKSSLNNNLYWAHKDNIVSHVPANIPNPNPVQKAAKIIDINKINQGDIIKVNMSGLEVEGTIVKTYKSGPNKGMWGVASGKDKFIVDPQTADIIDHTAAIVPKPVIKQIDYSSYENLLPGAADIIRDAEILRNAAKKDTEIIHKYTTSYYTTMNGYLRTGQNNSRTDNSLLKKEIEHLKEVLKKLPKPLSQDTRLTRMMGSNALDHVLSKDLARKIKDGIYGGLTVDEINAIKLEAVGGAIDDPAFISSTFVEGSFGSGNDVMMEIYTPKGYKDGMVIDSVSQYKGAENEYLFNSGTIFNITDIIFDNRKVIIKCYPEYIG